MSDPLPYVKDRKGRRSHVQEMEDYFAWHKQNGRSDPKWTVVMDRRGLRNLLLYAAGDLVGQINIVPPLDEETFDPTTMFIYVSARF